MNTRHSWLAVAALLTGCTSLAPPYVRPAAPVAVNWPSHGETQDGADPAATGWHDFFLDARLRRVIGQALENNRTLRVAIFNVQKARATYRIQAASQWPAVALAASQTTTRTPTGTGGAPLTGSAVSRTDDITLGINAYELDLFGRIASLKNEALERYLATEEARRGTALSLVSEVADDWLALGAFDQSIALATRNLQSQQDTYALVMRKHALGAVSALDVAQAQSALEAARDDLARYTTTAMQARNALELAVGTQVDEHDLPDATMDAPATLDSLSAGVPSIVLARRPDVLAAEHALEASNADVGAARANFFPRISLTASGGSESSQLSALFHGASRSWSLAPAISLPIFDGGSNRANLNAARAQRQMDLANYELVIQTAFRDVADALATQSTIRTRLGAQQAAVEANQRSYDLSMALYRQGRYSFLDVLIAQRSLYAAQQAQVSIQLAARTNLVTLYKALGGDDLQHDAR